MPTQPHTKRENTLFFIITDSQTLLTQQLPELEAGQGDKCRKNRVYI